MLVGHRQLVLTEGEFDALVLWQEARDLVDVALSAAARAGPRLRVLWYLTPYRPSHRLRRRRRGRPRARQLRTLSTRLHRRPPPERRGRNGFHLDGGSLRSWVQFYQAPASELGIT